MVDHLLGSGHVPKPWDERWRRDDAGELRGGQGVSFVATGKDDSRCRARGDGPPGSARLELVDGVALPRAEDVVPHTNGRRPLPHAGVERPEAAARELFVWIATPNRTRIGQLRHCLGFLVARSSLPPSLVGANLRVWGRAAGNSRVRREGLQLRSDQLRVVTHREVVAARHLHLAHIGAQRPPSPLEPQRVVELTEDRLQRPIGQ